MEPSPRLPSPISRRAILGVLALVVLSGTWSPASLAAQAPGADPPSPSHRDNPSTLTLTERWRAMADEAEELLLAGRYAKARRTIGRLTAEMIERVGPWTRTRRALGVALVLRATAEAGLLPTPSGPRPGRSRGVRAGTCAGFHVALPFPGR